MSVKTVNTLLTNLNEVLNRPTTPYSLKDNGTRHEWHVNHLQLNNYAPRYYQIEVISNDSGGTSQIGDGGTIAEIEARIRGMLSMHYGLHDYTTANQ